MESSPTTSPTRITVPASNSTESDKGELIWIIPVSITGALLIVLALYCLCKKIKEDHSTNQVVPKRHYNHGHSNPVYGTGRPINRTYNNQIYGTRC